ncbi:MAG: hypothetical protein D4R65_01455 [Verrucomicrobiaceae bacterium]|nr:MAG: hypothetical protein D4R65_01455 [Verrucomicrobiaceae bacterium]
MKIVGSGRKGLDSPADYVRRAERIIAAANRMAPHPKPRGFVVKSRSWQEYTAWRLAQTDPRFW